MRTRSYNRDVVSVSATSHESENGVPGGITYNWAGFTFTNGINHTIIDELPEWQRYGSCFHEKFEVTPLPGVLDHYRAGATRRYVAQPYALYNRAIRGPGVEYGFKQKRAIFNDIEGWENLSEYALDSMIPSFREDISLVNFILELKDLKRIPDLWSKRRSFLKNVANAHLNYKFGIAPLVSDITKLVSALSNFNRKVRFLEENKNSTIVRHYRQRMHVPKPPSAEVLYVEYTGEYQVHMRSIWVARPVYTASMKLRYALPDLNDPGNRAKALLDSLGVRPDGQIVWNAIPFSFLIDWFSQVGDFLGALSADNLKIPVTIVDFCHSVKFTVRNILMDYDFGTLTDVAHMDIDVYQRKRDIPVLGMPSLRGSDLDFSEILLGTSLLVANSK